MSELLERRVQRVERRIEKLMADLELPMSDFLLAVAAGNVANHSSVNKFGRAPSGVQTTATDIWDRADATPTQQVWTAPTTARTHDIASTSGSDDGDPAGVGARTVRVYGLTDWATAEVSEDITLNGTGNVATANSYVIIHRMKVLTKGATNVNVGIITATAQTDGTVTAQINASEGQTQMAIYGIPSTQTAYLTNYYISLASAPPATADVVAMELLVNPEPDAELTNFLVKHTQGIISDGSSYIRHEFGPYYSVAGPAIIKVQGVAESADTDVSAGFDLILKTN
jgi:hypothetical protein